MGNYNFEKDLKSSYQIEREFGAFLEARKKVKDITYNDNNKYDIKAVMNNGDVHTIEVKHDIMSDKTGNIAVEYECRGKPSGIRVTQANFWVYKLSDGYWIIPTQKLTNLILEKKFTRLVTGGDKDSNTKMFLFTADALKKEMKRIE